MVPKERPEGTLWMQEDHERDDLTVIASNCTTSIRLTTVIVIGSTKGRTYGLLYAAQVNYTRKLRRRNKYLGHSFRLRSRWSGSSLSARAKIIIGPYRQRSLIAFFAILFSQRASL